MISSRPRSFCYLVFMERRLFIPIKNCAGQLALDLEDPYGGEVLKCKSVEVLSLGLKKALFLEIELAETNDGWRFHVAARCYGVAVHGNPPRMFYGEPVCRGAGPRFRSRKEAIYAASAEIADQQKWRIPSGLKHKVLGATNNLLIDPAGAPGWQVAQQDCK